MNKHDNYFKNKYINEKKERRKDKQINKRKTDAETVIFIFEKLLDGWATIRIFNTIRQTDASSIITKKQVEKIATGNIKLFENELEPERFLYYQTLRKNIYELHNKKDNGTSEFSNNSTNSPIY
jgi:hypothetical protein